MLPIIIFVFPRVVCVCVIGRVIMLRVSPGRWTALLASVEEVCDDAFTSSLYLTAFIARPHPSLHSPPHSVTSPAPELCHMTHT